VYCGDSGTSSLLLHLLRGCGVDHPRPTEFQRMTLNLKQPAAEAKAYRPSNLLLYIQVWRFGLLKSSLCFMVWIWKFKL